MYRYELIDVQWEQIAAFFPARYHQGGAGHPWKEHRPMVNGILWHLHTGAPWPDLPERYGPWKTVYDRFNRWRKDGTWAKILDALLLRLDKAGFIDRDLWLVDASVIRASRAAAGAKKNLDSPPRLAGPEPLALPAPSDHALGRSQGGFGTKVHLVGEGHGTVLAVWVTPGQRHESQAFATVLLRAQRPRRAGRPRWPQRLAGDKGYSYSGIRAWLRRHHIAAVIASRKDQPRDDTFDPVAYRRRNLSERVVGWYKEYRALGTRYEKLAVNYVALWRIAIIEKLLRKYAERLQKGLSERT
jgi:transposase